jgi:phosphonate transport system substrate-binding protein
MMQMNHPIRCLAWAIRVLHIAAMVVVVTACGSDSEYIKVDFTEKGEASLIEFKPADRKTLRVAVAAMVSPQETFIYYQELIDYLGARSNLDVLLVQRRTYSEINQMLAKAQIDIAFTCTGPYVSGGKDYGFEAVATPVVRGEPYYQSYLIVSQDSPFHSLADLKGKRFAFSDPESNTGALVPQFWLRQIDQTPESFFQTFTYTYSHDNSILAVAKKLVDAAAVDGHIWEYYRRRNDFYVRNTRVIQKSEPFGSPPLVMSVALDPKIKETLIKIIMRMHEDPKGAEILSELMIDRFTVPKGEWYMPVARMLNVMGKNTGQGKVD